MATEGTNDPVSSETPPQETDASKEEDGQLEAPTNRSPAMVALPLDWTQLGITADDENACRPPPFAAIRYPWDVVDDMDIDDPELVIVGTAGQKITRIGADLPKRCHPHLKSLVLRSHLIQTMDPCLQQFRELETLELYDNMIEDLQYLGPTNHSSLAAIENNDTSANEEVAASSATATSPTDQVITLGPPGNTLKILDMSYNAIRDMAPVAYCPHLVELYLANNKLKAMAGLRELSNLRKLDLGANKLREMDPNELAGLLSLEELWLGKNKIETIQGLDHLTKLRRLDVQSNRLTCVDQLQHLVETLEELYLAHNGLTDEGVTNFTKWDFAQLSTLDLSRNQLTTTVSLSHLTTLEELWLSGNQITNFENGVLQPLASLVNLETVYLEYNPIAQEFEYRINLKERIPSLQQIDATPILTVHHVTTSTGATQPRGVLLPPTSRELQEQVIHRARAEMEQQQQSTNTTKADKS